MNEKRWKNERMSVKKSTSEEEHIQRNTKTSANETIIKRKRFFFFAIFIRSISFYIHLLMVDETSSHNGWLNEKLWKPKRNAKFCFLFTQPFQNITAKRFQRMNITNIKRWRTYFYSLFDSMFFFFFLQKRAITKNTYYVAQLKSGSNGKMHLITMHFYKFDWKPEP